VSEVFAPARIRSSTLFGAFRGGCGNFPCFFAASAIIGVHRPGALKSGRSPSVRGFMKHSVPHDIGQERAKKVAESALATYAEKYATYNPKVTWTGPNTANISFKVKGMELKGALEVLEKSIDMDIDVPFLLRPFKSQALGVIEGEINAWIKKAKAEG